MWLLEKHYAKRIPPIIYSFGLYDKDISIDVCTFGQPTRLMNSGDCLFNDEYHVPTIELNRLVVNEGLPKNTLNYFIGQCLKLIKKPMCIVSYADSNVGHHGYIYQATNWMCTGKTEKRAKFFDVNGKEIHERTLWSRYGNEQNALKSGVKKTYQEGKYRYFKFLGNKKEITKMKTMFRYKIYAYPKGDNQRYNASYKPIVQRILFAE
jgi:hypothetical protein